MNGPLIVAHLYDICWFFGCAACGLVLGRLLVWLYNKIPSSWLCDYGEEPGPEQDPPRLYQTPHGSVLGGVLFAAFLLLYLQYGGVSLYFFSCCAISLLLVLIAAADAQFSIIPDQFTLLLMIPAAAIGCFDLITGQAIFLSDPLSPLWGALSGAGIFLLMGLIGKLVYQKESIGFGDIKLFAVFGFLFGFPQIFIVFLLCMLLAGIHFLYLMLRKKITRESYLPLGPYLCLGGFLYLAFNRQINYLVSWYLSFL